MSPSSFPATADPRAQRHLYWIDWMRFLAAAFVLLDHACLVNWAGPELIMPEDRRTLLKLLFFPIHLGRQSVVVFFVLSGALVGGLTLEKFRAGTFDARAYAADRIARIFVPLIPALLLSVAVLRFYEAPVYPLQFAGCVFGLQGAVTHTPHVNSPLWSLSYEMWFYVLAGCAVVAAGRGRAVGARLAALAGVGVAIWILCFRLDCVNLVCWLVGAAGFGLRHRIGRGARPWLAAAGGLMMLAGAAGFREDLLAKVPGVADVAPTPWFQGFAHLVLAVGTLLLVVSACLSAPKTRLVARLERAGSPPAAFSYTLYLTHFPLLLALRWSDEIYPVALTWPSLLRLGGWVAVSVAVSALMYALFERQTPRARRWLRARFGGAPGRAAAEIPAPPPLAVEA